MAKVRNSENTGYLKDGNGNFIDSSQFDEDPTDEGFALANKIPEEEIDDLVTRLFPDIKIPPEEDLTEN